MFPPRVLPMLKFASCSVFSFHQFRISEIPTHWYTRYDSPSDHQLNDSQYILGILSISVRLARDDGMMSVVDNTAY